MKVSLTVRGETLTYEADVNECFSKYGLLEGELPGAQEVMEEVENKLQTLLGGEFLVSRMSTAHNDYIFIEDAKGKILYIPEDFVIPEKILEELQNMVISVEY